jgi:hypothetical protein
MLGRVARRGSARLSGRVALTGPQVLSRCLSTDPPAPPGNHIRDFQDLSGEALFRMSVQQGGCLGSSRERLVREVMLVDKVSREDATEVVRGMARKNAEGMTMSVLPYKIGIHAAYVGAWVSIPMVFSIQIAKTFNDVMVTTDVPEPADLNTTLECGMWTWGWMEPPLGTISFFLLCLQYARDQKINIGQKPWTTYWKEKQGDRLAAAYPQYHKQIVLDYGRETCFEDDSDDF